MDNLKAEQGEQYGPGTSRPFISDRTRDIKKWQAIASMVDPDPDVLSFSLTSTESERRWAFFTRASGISRPGIPGDPGEVDDRSEEVVMIF